MRRHFVSLLVTSLFVVTFGAQAAPRNAEPVVEVTPIPDPIEPFNRAVFQFNRGVDFLILNPAATACKKILPQFARDSIDSFLSNLASPIYMANELLQWDIKDFDIVLRRFVVNSTLGMGGLIDVAGYHGLPAPAPEDFGQTMGKWGADHGIYVVLPVIGSSSLRDGTGFLVDSYADPFNSWARNTDRDWALYTRGGVAAVNKRAKIGESYNDIMQNAVDPYVTFRSIYKQNRDYLIQDQAVDSYADAEAGE